MDRFGRRELIGAGVIGMAGLGWVLSSTENSQPTNTTETNPNSTEENTGNNDQSTNTGPLSEKWTYNVGDEPKYQLQSVAKEGKSVFLITKGGMVISLSAEDGSKQWDYKISDRYFGEMVVLDGTVYAAAHVIGNNDNVYALSADDGTKRWSYETENHVRDDITVGDGAAYMVDDNNILYALSTDDGSERWRLSLPEGEGITTYRSPQANDNNVYIGNSDGLLLTLSTTDGTEAWRFEADGKITDKPAVTNDTVFVSQKSTLYALSTADGNEKWSYKGKDYIREPCVIDENVYAGTWADAVIALSAEDGTKTWTFPTEGAVNIPVVVDNTVYALGTEYLYALSGSNGTEKWRHSIVLSGDLKGPIIEGDSFYFGSGTDVFAFTKR